MKRWLAARRCGCLALHAQALQVTDDRGVAVDAAAAAAAHREPAAFADRDGVRAGRLRPAGRRGQLFELARRSAQAAPAWAGWTTPTSRPSSRCGPMWCCCRSRRARCAAAGGAGAEGGRAGAQDPGGRAAGDGQAGAGAAGARRDRPCGERIDDGVNLAAQSLPAALRGTTVYFEVSSGPYAASESSFIGEMLARVGAANVVPGKLGPFPKLNPEFVVRADPAGDHDLGPQRPVAERPAGLEPHPRDARRPRLRVHSGPGRRAGAAGPADGRGRAVDGAVPARQAGRQGAVSDAPQPGARAAGPAAAGGHRRPVRRRRGRGQRSAGNRCGHAR